MRRRSTGTAFFLLSDFPLLVLIRTIKDNCYERKMDFFISTKSLRLAIFWRTNPSCYSNYSFIHLSIAKYELQCTQFSSEKVMISNSCSACALIWERIWFPFRWRAMHMTSAHIWIERDRKKGRLAAFYHLNRYARASVRPLQMCEKCELSNTYRNECYIRLVLSGKKYNHKRCSTRKSQGARIALFKF